MSLCRFGFQLDQSNLAVRNSEDHSMVHHGETLDSSETAVCRAGARKRALGRPWHCCWPARPGLLDLLRPVDLRSRHRGRSDRSGPTYIGVHYSIAGTGTIVLHRGSRLPERFLLPATLSRSACLSSRLARDSPLGPSCRYRRSRRPLITQAACLS